jgi:hypothetical protein
VMTVNCLRIMQSLVCIKAKIRHPRGMQVRQVTNG